MPRDTVRRNVPYLFPGVLDLVLKISEDCPLHRESAGEKVNFQIIAVIDVDTSDVNIHADLVGKFLALKNRWGDASVEIPMI